MAGENGAHDNALHLLHPLMDRLPTNLAGASDVVRYDMTSEEDSGFDTFFESLPDVVWAVWIVCLITVLVSAALFLYYLRTPPKIKRGPPLLSKELDDESSEQIDLASTDPGMHFLRDVIKGLGAQ